MKKSVLEIIGGILVFGFVVGLCIFCFINNKKQEEKLTTITLDINPSLEIKVDKNEVVKSIRALNDDAKELKLSKLKNKNIDEALNILVEKIIENDYSNGDRAYIILNVEGTIKSDVIENKLNTKFKEHNYDAEVIVPVITDEAKEIAKKYNITPAKAAFLKETIKDNKDIDIDSLKDKPVRELKDMQVRHVYCPDEYTLEGEVCTKVIDTKAPTIGNVCPEGYEEDNGICYKSESIIDKETCIGGQSLKKGKCVGTKEIDALVKYTCTNGELIKRSEIPYRDLRDNGNPEDMMCMDKSTGQKPTQRCLLNSGHIMIDGECYNGPAPLLPTPTGCEGDDLQINGWCYSKDDGDQWQCPNGDIYEYSKETYTEYCPDTFTYTFAASSYYCEKDYELIDGKCVTKKDTNPDTIRVCNDGYTLFQDRVCLDYNTSTNYVEGKVCNYENSRYEDGKCLILDVADAIEY